MSGWIKNKVLYSRKHFLKEGFGTFFFCKGLCMLSHFSHIQLFVTLWTVARQAPLPMGFSRQEYWSGLPFLSPGDVPHPGIKPESLTSPALVGRFLTTSAAWEALYKAG